MSTQRLERIRSLPVVSLITPSSPADQVDCGSHRRTVLPPRVFAMSQPDTPEIRIAHGQLRFIVLACCWLVGLSLCAQILIWSLATFTEMRYAEATTSDSTPLVVQAVDNQTPSIITATEANQYRGINTRKSLAWARATKRAAIAANKTCAQ